MIIILAAVIAVYVAFERWYITRNFYADPEGRRCFVCIESGSTSVWIKGTVRQNGEDEEITDMYFVRTDKGFLYVAEMKELKPVYFEWPTNLINY